MLKKWTAALLVACMLFTLPTPVSQASNETGAVPTVVDVSEEEVSEEATSDDVVVDDVVVDDVVVDDTVIDDTVIDDADVSSEETTGEQDAEDAVDTEIHTDMKDSEEEVLEKKSIIDESTDNSANIVNEEQNKVVEENNSTDSMAQETVDDSVNEFNAEVVYNEVLSANSADEIEKIVSELDEGQKKALLEIVKEEDILQLAEQLGIDTEEKIYTPAKNYTNVGELMPAVNTSTAKKRMALRSGKMMDDNGLVLSKNAKYDAESNSVKIVLEAYTTGKVTSSSKAIPTDIVLVLDESGSMAENMYQYSKVYDLNTDNNYYVKRGDSYVQVSYCRGGILSHNEGWYTGIHLIFFHWGTRYDPLTSVSDSESGHVQFYTRSEVKVSKNEALKNAAKTFVESVESEAKKNNVDHRIAVIGFAGNAETKIGLSDDIRNNKPNVLKAIDQLKTNGGTYIEKGMRNAKDAFANAAETTTTTRKRVVVVFTDGIPGNGEWNDKTINNSANPAINSSYELKNTYGATVYTIGMLDDADPELAISDDANDSARTNKFLHYLSSNYPNARSMKEGGTGGGNNGYYLSASDTDSLNAIFQKIKDEISVPTISLGSDTVIKDIVSPYFDIPEQASNISVKTYDCLSYDEERQQATWSPNGTAMNDMVTLTSEGINVSGFDFNSNFVSRDVKPETRDHGKKLVIEFTVTPKAGFLGGNKVPTNGIDSGVYDKDNNLVELFKMPTVDVPIKQVTVSAQDKKVYLLGDVSADAMKSGATITAGTVEIDPTANNFGLQSWQNEFVNITVSTDPAVGFSDLKEDKIFTLSCNIAPTSEGSSVMSSGSDRGNILVFKPTVTFKDSTVYYGDVAPTNPNDYDVNNFVGTVWKHDSEVASETVMGEAPHLIFDYSMPEVFSGGKVNTKEDISVNVTVKINNTDVTSYTTFEHKPCVPTCAFKPDKEEFLLHVKTCSLTINKSGGKTGEYFIFNVEKDDATYMSVVVPANKSVSIKELPVGTYTIKEDESWSWRYTPSFSNNNKVIQVILSKSNSTDTVTCTNTPCNNKWLTDTAKEKNVYGKSKTTTKGGNN